MMCIAHSATLVQCVMSDLTTPTDAFPLAVRLFALLANTQLLRTLLGDFDFEGLKRSNRVLGPLFFALFVTISVFVVLNMLIAIIA